MKSVAVVVLVSFVTFAAGASNTTTKVLSSLLSTRDEQSDLIAFAVYLISCPAALAHHENCLAQHSNYNPDPVGDAETCEMGRIQLDCLDSTFAATTCPGEQDAIDAVGRIRQAFESRCTSLENAATSVVTGFFMVITMVCVNLVY